MLRYTMSAFVIAVVLGILVAGCQEAREEPPEPFAADAETAKPRSNGRGLLGYVLGTGDGEWLNVPFPGHTIIKASRVSGARQIAVFAARQENDRSTRLHRHDYADEIFYVHSGFGTWTMEGEEETLGAGSTIFVPRGAWHAYQAAPAFPLEVVFIMSAPGLEEGFRAGFGPYGGAGVPWEEIAERFVLIECAQDGPVECKTTPPSVEGYTLQRSEGELFAPDAEGRQTIIKASPETGSPETMMFTQEIPQGAGTLTQTYSQAEEVIYVDEGAGIATLDAMRYALEEGSIVFAPPGVSHGIENPDQPMHLVRFVTRPGLEGFFRETLSRPGESLKVLTPEQIQDILKKHEPR